MMANGIYVPSCVLLYSPSAQNYQKPCMCLVDLSCFVPHGTGAALEMKVTYLIHESFPMPISKTTE